jgi:hypothetical protein
MAAAGTPGDEADLSMADELLDDLMPPEFDWRGVVRRHPIPALAVAAAAGYWIGSSRRSAALIDAVMGAVTAGVVAKIGGLAGAGDGFDEADEPEDAAE